MNSITSQHLTIHIKHFTKMDEISFTNVSKIGSHEINIQFVLISYSKDYQGVDVSKELRQSEGEKAELIKEVLQQKLDEFISKQRRLLQNGVSIDAIKDLLIHKLSYEAHAWTMGK